MSSADFSRNSPSNGIFAAPLSVEGVDDNDLDGHIPRDILLAGTQIKIPRPDDTGPKDQLMVFWVQNSVETLIFDNEYPAGIIDPFVYVPLTPQQMATNGVAHVYYNLWKRGGGNPDLSPLRKLTINHKLPLTFSEPSPVGATTWGYWNNDKIPPLTSGGAVKIPSLLNIALSGYVAVITWRGYQSINGSGTEVEEAFGQWRRTLSETEIINGFMHEVPFPSYISSLGNYGSAVFICQVFDGSRLVAESKEGLVKIDRITPGTSGPSGLNSQGETTMGITFVPRKQRPVSVLSGGGVLNLTITIDTLAGGFIKKAMMDSGKLMINLARPDDEHDDDEVGFKYREKGEVTWIDYPDDAVLGPIAGRPVSPIPLDLDANLFKEKATSPGPTVWELLVRYYKEGGGNFDDGQVEFIVDQLAPVDTKNPPKKIKPTPAPSFDNGPADAQKTVDSTWINSNQDVEGTVNVGYFGRRVDDNLRVWLVSGTQRVEVFNGTVDATGKFSFPSTELLVFPNGRVNWIYEWTDWIGNQGQESVSAPLLTLKLPLAPSINKAPLVPKTDPSYTTTLYWEDFLSTTTPPAPIALTAIVENSTIQDAEPGDEIYLVLTKANDVTVSFDTAKQPWANGNLTYSIDFNNVYPRFADPDSPVDININSVIVRAGLSPDAESPLATFTFDSRLAGVIPTNPPDLENADLQRPVVTGASGVANVVAATDRDKPGTFTVTNALADPDILPEHEVKCYLGNATVPFETFSPFRPVSSFSVPIPASEMAKLKPPSDTARYTIEITGLGKNINKSLPQAVVVNQIPIVLPPPTVNVRKPATRDYIECFAMISPTSNYVMGLNITKDPLLPPGTIITAHFEAYSDAAGTQLINGTADSQPYTIKAADVPDVAGVGTATNFKAAQPKRGVIAYGKYWYTAAGGTQSSAPIIKPLDTINSSFQYCDLTVAPA
ncbi:hypothetical protein [Pseudomonas fluorescens]|uniref:hypothetical protein n=1 Tax=Pseudomonas fluorescens TaxID=294 RepID=UPI000ABFBC0B|nr:hypothetical protein [Pseudomonas fluorescens]